MDYLYKKIKEIEMNPELYLNDNSLLLLKTFLDGYSLRDHEIAGEESSLFLHGFQQYVAEFYKVFSYYSWSQIISNYCQPTEQPFQVFFTLIERYVNDNPQYKHD